MNLKKSIPLLSIGTYIHAYIDGNETACQVIDYCKSGEQYHYLVVDKEKKEHFISVNDFVGYQE